MNWDNLETFLAAVRIGSLNQAASSLHVGQSTVSLRIRALEQSLGLHLLERHRGIRGLRLTPAGWELYELGTRWEQLRDQIVNISPRQEGGTLVMGTVDSASTYVLPALFRMIAELSPPLHLRIMTSSTSTDLYQLLDHHEIDAAIAFVWRPSPDLQAQTLFTEPLVLLQYDGDSLSEPVSWTTLNPEQECYMHWSPEFAHWHRERWNLRLPRVQLDVAHMLPTFLMKPGDWAIVPWSVAHTLQERGSFAIRELEDPPPPRTCYCITPKNGWSHAREGLELFNPLLRQWMEEWVPRIIYSRSP